MHCQKPGEYGLNINADVALWMDSRAYNKQPPLRQVHGFVIVTPELHEEFDSFRAKETSKYNSILREIRLLKCWNLRRPVPTPTIAMYGKAYLMLFPSDCDSCRQNLNETLIEFLALTQALHTIFI